MITRRLEIYWYIGASNSTTRHKKTQNVVKTNKQNDEILHVDMTLVTSSSLLLITGSFCRCYLPWEYPGFHLPSLSTSLLATALVGVGEICRSLTLL